MGAVTSTHPDLEAPGTTGCEDDSSTVGRIIGAVLILCRGHKPEWRLAPTRRIIQTEAPNIPIQERLCIGEAISMTRDGWTESITLAGYQPLGHAAADRNF